MSRLGYSGEQREALLAGKIVTTDMQRSRDDQLIAAAAMKLPAGIEALWQGVGPGRSLDSDPGILAIGELGLENDETAWAQLRFEDSERKEAERLLAFRGGSDFNLSRDEIESLKAETKGIRAESDDMPDKVSAVYRGLLMDRHQAYLARGLSGVAAYQQGGTTLHPAKELSASVAQAKDFLTTFFPAFWAAFSGFPEAQDPEILNKFFWIKREVEGRPAFVLVHEMVTGGTDHILLTRREHFVGHTYESLQVVALALPVEGGSALFYVNSAFTDQITGFFSGVAQSVGQDRMKDDLTAYFEAVKERRSE